MSQLPAPAPVHQKLPKYELPSNSFPYKIKRRLNIMARSARPNVDQDACMPAVNPRGIRESALRGAATDRVIEAGYPYLRRLLLLKRMYKNMLTPEKLERIDHMIEVVNGCMYSKLANCVIKLNKLEGGTKERKKKAWTDSDWKKHTDYILQICQPKQLFENDPIDRGPKKPLHEMMPRIKEISVLPAFKIWHPLSEDPNYLDPTKVKPSAFKYVISERVKFLAQPKKLPEE